MTAQLGWANFDPVCTSSKLVCIEATRLEQKQSNAITARNRQGIRK